MRLSFRPAKAQDLLRCQKMLAEWAPFIFEAEVLSELPKIWQELSARKSLNATIFEDLDLPLNRRLRGFSLGVFLAHARIEKILEKPKPYLANFIFASCLGSDPWPLGFSQLRQANATDGVNLFTVCVLFTLNWRSPDLLPIFALIQEAFRFEYYGYRLRLILQECFGEEACSFLLAQGLKLYRAHRGRKEDPQPFLMGLSRKEALACPGSALAFYFAAPSPKFYFRPSEQDLLRLALRHLSDQEAALELGVSLNTIKKRWQDIFRKVEENDPGLFPNKGLISNQRGGKRRHFLAYLAHHLEELRPQKPLR